ncbi:hypothetical protein N9Q05_00140 [bacterium]|nr:hypothetical protein [bacterium]
MKCDSNLVTLNNGVEPINVGGSGFRALAVWLIDNVEAMDAFGLHDRMTMDWIRVVLNGYFDYFPQHCVFTSSTITPLSCMKQLIASVPILELLSSLTWTLGCIAVEELFSCPTLYQNVFCRRKTVSLSNLVSQILTQPNQYCIAALATALHLDIEIHYVGNQQAVYSRFQYFHPVMTVDTQKVTLQLQDGDYFLLVATPRKWHTNLYQVTPIVLKPMLDAFINKNQRINIDEMIFYADKALLEKFEHYYLKLRAKVAAGDLMLADLIAIYTGRDRSQPVDKRVGTEQGNQRYFNQMMQRHGDVTGVTFSTAGYLDEMTNTMLHALARAVSLGEINPVVIDRSEPQPSGSGNLNQERKLKSSSAC